MLTYHDVRNYFPEPEGIKDVPITFESITWQSSVRTTQRAFCSLSLQMMIYRKRLPMALWRSFGQKERIYHHILQITFQFFLRKIRVKHSFN